MPTPADRLRRVREASGYATAKDAALAMGVAISTYTHHEKPPYSLPLRRAEKYAAFFGTTPEYLLFGR